MNETIADLQFVVTDEAGEKLLDGLDIGVGKAISYILATPQRPDDADNTLTHAFGTEAYGSSESSGMIALAPDGPPGALGRPARDAVRVVDPRTLAPCPPARLDPHGRVINAEEAVGELVDTEGAARFEGYYKNPEADAERIKAGWYWTGDLAYRDEAGFLYFAGRSGDWIRVDGENISALLTERVEFTASGRQRFLRGSAGGGGGS